MPQTSRTSESGHGSAKVEFSAHAVEKSDVAESVKATHRQLINKSVRQSKCLSAAANNFALSKKQPHSQPGPGIHPYQSHPVNTRFDLHIASRDNLSSFTQRVMSAKLLRLKQLQNQLSEAHLQLNELLTENRLLRSLQKRQDLALDRYEGTQAQLPQLVRSHQEEVRVLRTKYKNLKHQYRSVTNILKEKETELQNLKEQHAHLLKLSKDRTLGERESLMKQVNDLKQTVDNQASTIQVLNRKVLLEGKNFKFQLHQEMQRHKATQSELQDTYLKMDQLQSQLDQAKGRNSLPTSMDRFGNTSSFLKLTGASKSAKVTSIDKLHPQSFRIKKTSKESVVFSNNTEPSSVQLDSSPATTLSNEFSASIDSSPEHTTNDSAASNSSQLLSAPVVPSAYKFHKTILQKGRTEMNVNNDSNRVTKIADPPRSPYAMASASNDILEKEYENAVAMLAELSTKHNGSFGDISSSPASLDVTSAKHVAALANATSSPASLDVTSAKHVAALANATSSPASLDETSAKHVAALANATFSLQGEVLMGPKFKHDESLGLSRKSSKVHKDNVSPTFNKRQESFINEDSSSRGAHTRLQTVEGKSEFVSRSSNDDVENKLEIPKLFSDDIMPKHESSIAMQDGITQKTRKSSEEQMETSCKEALLRALKAIDDNSNQDNDSDDSESVPMKMLSTGNVIPQSMFSTLSSSAVGVGDVLGSSTKGKSFK